MQRQQRKWIHLICTICWVSTPLSFAVLRTPGLGFPFPLLCTRISKFPQHVYHLQQIFSSQFLLLLDVLSLDLRHGFSASVPGFETGDPVRFTQRHLYIFLLFF